MLVPTSACHGTDRRRPAGMGGDRAGPQAAGARAGRASLEMPLGPAVGQCCGGHVTLAAAPGRRAASWPRLRPTEAAAAAACRRAAVRCRPCRPRAGRGAGAPAAAAALDRRPRRTSSRPSRRRASRRSSPTGRWPRSSSAPAGSACFVLTHSHSLDFTPVQRRPGARRLRLSRLDRLADQARQVRARLSPSSAFRRRGSPRMACPIGGDALRDKRPAVIAALAAAEV